MKTFLILCSVLVARIQAELVLPFPMHYDQIVDVCRKETGYTDNMVAKEKKTYFSENRGLRKFNYCFLEKTGFVTSDGKLNIDESALNDIEPIFFKDILELCYGQEITYPKNIFSTCFHWAVSTYLRVLEFNHHTELQIENFTQIADVCRNETGYTDEVIAEEEKSDLNKDGGLKKFNYCFLEKTGFKDDKFDIDVVLAEMPETNVREIIEFCNSKFNEKEIPYSVPNFSACLHLVVSKYLRSVATNHFYALRETKYVTDIVDACRMKTGYTKEVQNMEEEGNFTEDATLRKFNNCFLEKTGFITSDGKLHIDAALAKLPPSFAKPVVEHCQANVIFKKNTTDFVHDFSTCYHDGIQNHISLAMNYAFSVSTKLVLPGTSYAEKDLLLL